jgi:hypothetical protein
MALHNAHVVCYLLESGGWYEQTLEADHWASLGDVTSTDAAMLLCQFNPHAKTYESAKLSTTDELRPEHLIRLAERLADIDKADHRKRTLRDWHQTARDKELVYHSWIDGYMEMTATPKVAVSPSSKPQTAPGVSQQQPTTPNHQSTKASIDDALCLTVAEASNELYEKRVPSSNGHPAASPEMATRALKAAYKLALSHYQAISDVDLDAVPDKWTLRPPMPKGAIQSADMQKCERTLEHELKGGTFSAWLAYSPTDFDAQMFERLEIQRWIEAIKIQSEHELKKEVPKEQTAAPAPVGDTSVAVPKQRAQENEILKLLKTQGYDPLKLEARQPGKPGPKAEIRTLALHSPKLFTQSSFDKAWERLRSDGAVIGAT